jgi:anti-anti-sigma factor
MPTLSEEIIDGVTVLHLSGSLTQDAVPPMEARFGQLAGIKGGRIVVDVAKVDALTTPAITVFLSTVRSLEETGGRLVFANVRGITGDIFTRCRLDVIFTMAATLPEALQIARR